MTTTLIISTYNRDDAIEVCLSSVAALSTLPDEVIVGDDGSTEETQRVIERLQVNFPVPLRYIRQEDNGFRVGMIRNKCIAAAKGEYIVQIDGDIMLHPDFIADHLSQARRGCFLKGGRVKLGRRLTEKICRQRHNRSIPFFTFGIESKRANTLRLQALASFLAPRYRRNRNNVLGCNFSFFRDDFIAVNGYDESIEGWGGEDLDLSFRLCNHGLKKRYLKFCALAYHLWHHEASKSKSEANHKLAYNHHREGIVRAQKGVDQYL